MDSSNKFSEAEQFISDTLQEPSPNIAVILGSGLGAFGEELTDRKVIEVSKIPNWPTSTVPGHKGLLIYGKIDGHSLIVLQGRVHYYEGYSIQEVVFPIRVMGTLGIKSVIITNASGGLNPRFKPGDLMFITDHINLMFVNPLIGQDEPFLGPRFPDMTHPYDKEYLEVAIAAARDLKIPVKKGILLATTGPSYETVAEVRMMRLMGADAACMSTVPEVIAGVQIGLRILGLSCITNMGTGIAKHKLTHDEVERTAQKTGQKFTVLLQEIIGRISERQCQSTSGA